MNSIHPHLGVVMLHTDTTYCTAHDSETNRRFYSVVSIMYAHYSLQYNDCLIIGQFIFVPDLYESNDRLITYITIS